MEGRDDAYAVHHGVPELPARGGPVFLLLCVSEACAQLFKGKGFCSFHMFSFLQHFTSFILVCTEKSTNI